MDTDYTQENKKNPSDYLEGLRLVKRHYTKLNRAIIESAYELGVKTPELAKKLQEKLGYRTVQQVYMQIDLTGGTK